MESVVHVVERVKLMAFEDSLLGRPVFVSVVLKNEAPDLERLAGHVHLGDLLDAVRKAHEKLPPPRHLSANGAVPAADEAPAGAVPAKPAAESFALPPEVLSLRFVFPHALEATLATDLFTRQGLGPLKPAVVGTGAGGPYQKLGLAGRARVAERTSGDLFPWLYVTVLQYLRVCVEAAWRGLDHPQKLSHAFNLLRDGTLQWLARDLPGARREGIIHRILANPMAPFALRRTATPPATGQLAQQLLESTNPWGLKPDVARDLDLHFDGALAGLLTDPIALPRMRGRITGALGIWQARDAWDPGEAAARRGYFHKVATALVIIPAAMLLMRLLTSPAGVRLGTWLIAPEFGWLLGRGLLFGILLGGVLGVFGSVQLWWRRRTSPVCRRFRDLSRTMRRLPAVRTRWTRAGWRRAAPGVLRGYLKFKADCLDYDALAKLPLPPVDLTAMYEPDALRNKWEQNSVACYDDAFPSLTSGLTSRAAVYFLDVVGSTEISTERTLANVLEPYTRMLHQANEAGLAPLWRKEIGDGRIYCHPPIEALKRAVLSIQGCAHPKVGLRIGIGLSVGEIQHDVTTGDFLNETSNRASRLNGRDELVGAWAAARFTQHPHRVHVKWGRLYNGGLAMDDRALQAVGAEMPPGSGTPPSPALEWRLPVLSPDGENATGTVTLIVERMSPEFLYDHLTHLGAGPAFDRFRKPGRAIAFEVFVHASAAGLPTGTQLNGRSPAEYLSGRHVEAVAYAAAEVAHDLRVHRVPVTLLSGESLTLVVKDEQASLKGLGSTAIAEAEIPALPIRDDAIRLTEFLARL